MTPRLLSSLAILGILTHIPSSLAEVSNTQNTTAVESKIWQQYSADRKARRTPEIPDFSYVGYHRGEKAIPQKHAQKVFRVEKFGAKANDEVSDTAAIQKAIDAAAANKGGVVKFGPGSYLLTSDNNQGLLVNHSSIILKGAGSGNGGTELYMPNALEAHDPKKMWTTPYFIKVEAPYKNRPTLSKITQDSPTESMTVFVDDSSKIQAGDWVALRRIDANLHSIQQELAPYDIDPLWTKLSQDGLQVREFHQVKALTRTTLTFEEPIHSNVEADSGWTIEKYSPLTEVGVEDIAFRGNWHEKFVHHKSALHDGGWSILQLNKVANGWVTRCRFTDLNCALSLKSSSNVTLSHLLLDGTKGHSAVSMNGCSHSLGAMITDTAGHHHASGVAGLCSGNVFWKLSYREDTSFESHASQPRHTLFDLTTGGFVDGRWGGSAANQPNHLRGLIFWNYHNLSPDKTKPYEWVKSNNKYGKIIMPSVIGFHGGHVPFLPEQTEHLESLGQKVLPNSLYLAQLKLRLGKLPAWVSLLDKSNQ